MVGAPPVRLMLMALTAHGLDPVLFEAASAFGIAGLSTESPRTCAVRSGRLLPPALAPRLVGPRRGAHAHRMMSVGNRGRGDAPDLK
ncbi:UNVERIFIED_ORG: hypothetical protein CLV66_113146 [Actinomadura viridilutea]